MGTEQSMTAMGAKVRQALAKGFKQPAIAVFGTVGPVTGPLWDAVGGDARESELVPIKDGLCARVVTVEAEDLARACEQLASVPACGVLARVLRDQTLGTVAFGLMIVEDRFGLAALDAGGNVEFTRQLPYYARYKGAQTLGEIANDEGPTMLHMEGEAGRTVIHGKSGGDAALSGVLVSAVSSGKMTIPDPETGIRHALQVTDELLVDLLSKAFSEGDGPAQVAEALRSLAKMPGDPSRKLRRVLANKNELAGLWVKVKYELSGEMPAA